MKFKHTLLVFIDNFSVIYKQLLYRFVIYIITWTASYFIMLNFVSTFIDSDAFNAIWDNIRQMGLDFSDGKFDALPALYKKISEAVNELNILINNSISRLIVSMIVIVAINAVGKWFTGLSNYTTCAIVNDKMALHANLPFFATMIINLKSAALFNLIYVPIAILYDCVICVLMIFLLSVLVSSSVLPLVFAVFFFALVLVIAVSIKMTITSDWLPALVRGQKSQKDALIYAFSRKGKQTLSVWSNYVVLILIIFAFNMIALVFTAGTGLLLTVPAGFVILIVFELVNYYDREQIKYFVDRDTIVRPAIEKTPTREDFFLDTN